MLAFLLLANNIELCKKFMEMPATWGKSCATVTRDSTAIRDKKVVISPQTWSK